MRKILVCLRQNDSSGAALRWAAERAVADGGTLHVVTAVPPVVLGCAGPFVSPLGFDTDALLRGLQEHQISVVAELLAGSTLPEIGCAVVFGSEFDVLRSAARDMDVVVLGASRGLRSRHLHRRCSRYLPCPVVSVGSAGLV